MKRLIIAIAAPLLVISCRKERTPQKIQLYEANEQHEMLKGIWNAVDTQADFSLQYNPRLLPSGHGDSFVVFSLSAEPTAAVIAHLAGNTFTIHDQTFLSNLNTVSGTGTMFETVDSVYIRWQYSVNVPLLDTAYIRSELWSKNK